MRKVAVVLALQACSGSKDTAPPPDGGTDDYTPTVDTEHTGVEPELDLTGNFGSIVLGHYPVDAYYDEAGYAVGLFLSDDGGIANLASCFGAGGECIDEYPAVGDTAVGVTDFSFLYTATFYDVGSSVAAGGVDLLLNQSYGYPLYFGSSNGLPTTGDLDLDGDFAPFSATDAFAITDPIVVTAPDPLQPVEVGPGAVIDLAWDAPGTGDVYLEVASGYYEPTADFVEHLDDDGSHQIQVDALGFTAPFDSKTLFVSRLLNTVVDAAGNAITVQTRSDQWLYVNYTDTTGWTELTRGDVMGETCADALLLPPVAAGQYFGDLSSFLDDHDLGYGNPVTYYGSAGEDGVIPVSMGVGQVLTASYVDTSNDASIYVLDDTCDLGGALAGSDATFYQEREELTFTAPATDTYYLVLDGYYTGYGGRFTLVLDIQ